MELATEPTIACVGSNHVPGCAHHPDVPKRGATVSRGTNPRPVTVLDDVLLEFVDVGDNIRIDPGELEELAASIRELGVLEPIKVTTQADGRYRVVFGQRRVLASRLAGQLRIPAIVEPPSDVDEHGARRSIEQLTENLQRKDLNPIEEAVALREVLDADPDLTQEALADKLGRSRPWVSNTLRLLAVDDTVQAKVRAGEISATHARTIAALPPKQQRELADRVVSHKLSAHDLEREIKWKLDAAEQEQRKAAKTEKWIPKAIAALEAAGVAKDVLIQLSGSYYDLDVDAVGRAIYKAGWKKRSSEWLRDRPEKGRCDCTAIKLEFGGRKAEIKPVCSDSRHQDRQANLDHVAEREREKRIEAKVDDLKARIRATLETMPLHPGIELLLAVSNHHELAKQTDRAPATLRTILAHRLALAASPRYAWGADRDPGEAHLDQVLAMFEPAPAAEPIEPPASTKRAKKAAG